MSGYGPYDGYEPNEPTPRRQRPLAPARTLNAKPDPSADPAEGAGFPYARRTWDEEEYTPNEPMPARAPAADDGAGAARPSAGPAGADRPQMRAEVSPTRDPEVAARVRERPAGPDLAMSRSSSDCGISALTIAVPPFSSSQ